MARSRKAVSPSAEKSRQVFAMSSGAVFSVSLGQWKLSFVSLLPALVHACRL